MCNEYGCVSIIRVNTAAAVVILSLVMPAHASRVIKNIIIMLQGDYVHNGNMLMYIFNWHMS